MTLTFWRYSEKFQLILTEAFTPRATITGGFVAVMIQGFRRAAFSNEAGIGTAPMMHGAAKTKEPFIIPTKSGTSPCNSF